MKIIFKIKKVVIIFNKMNPIVLIKKIKSKERPIHKESYRNTEIQIQKEPIFSTGSVPHILSDIQNTTDVIIINGNKNYIQRMKSLDDISLSNNKSYF